VVTHPGSTYSDGGQCLISERIIGTCWPTAVVYWLRTNCSHKYYNVTIADTSFVIEILIADIKLGQPVTRVADTNISLRHFFRTLEELQKKKKKKKNGSWG